jgi:hypothetical protein
MDRTNNTNNNKNKNRKRNKNKNKNKEKTLDSNQMIRKPTLLQKVIYF